jgi:hypothetical protein
MASKLERGYCVSDLEPKEYRTEVHFSNGESVDFEVANTSERVEGIALAIGGGLLRSFEDVFDQANSNQEYKDMLREIRECPWYRRKKKRELENRAGELWSKLAERAIIETFGSFEVLTISQSELDVLDE